MKYVLIVAWLPFFMVVFFCMGVMVLFIVAMNYIMGDHGHRAGKHLIDAFQEVMDWFEFKIVARWRTSHAAYEWLCGRTVGKS